MYYTVLIGAVVGWIVSVAIYRRNQVVARRRASRELRRRIRQYSR